MASQPPQIPPVKEHCTPFLTSMNAFDVNPLPSWCYPGAKITMEHITILEKSWKSILMGECQGFRQFISEGNLAFKKHVPNRSSLMNGKNIQAGTQSGTHTASNGSGNLSPVLGEPPQNLWNARPLSSQNELKISVEAEHFSSTQPTLPNQIPDLKLNEPGSQSAMHPEKIDEQGKHSRSNSSSPLNISSAVINNASTLTNVQISPSAKYSSESIQFLYDNYFEHLKSQPMILLKWHEDMKTRSKILLNLINFLVYNTAKTNTSEYDDAVQKIIQEYNSHNITAEDHDYLGRAFLVAIKTVIGSPLDSKIIIDAWKIAYSEFLKAGLQYVKPEQRFYVKRRNSDPVLFSSEAMVGVNHSKTSSRKKQPQIEPQDSSSSSKNQSAEHSFKSPRLEAQKPPTIDPSVLGVSLALSALPTLQLQNLTADSRTPDSRAQDSRATHDPRTQPSRPGVKSGELSVLVGTSTSTTQPRQNAGIVAQPQPLSDALPYSRPRVLAGDPKVFWPSMIEKASDSKVEHASTSQSKPTSSPEDRKNKLDKNVKIRQNHNQQAPKRNCCWPKRRSSR